MAEILPFARREPKQRRTAGDRTGEIVIFTGIRVEYHDRTPAPKGKQRPRRGKRVPPKGALSA
jgi:hypothetical protein